MGLKNNQFVRRLTLSYSALLLVILVMGVYLYTISISNVSSELRNQNKFILDRSVQDINTSFKTMDVLAGQIVSNSNITQISNAKGNLDNAFYLMAYHAKEDLSVYIFTESMLPIKNYYIYLKEPDYILSTGQFSSTSLYYSGIRKYYKDKYEDWVSTLYSADSYRKFILLDPYKSFADSTYLYILPLSEYSFKSVPATLCFELDYAMVEDIFSELNFFDSGYLYVTDASGNSMFSLKGEQFDDASRGLIKDLTFESDFAVMKSEKENMFVTRATSTYNGWQYYLVQPEDASLYSLKQYRNIFIAIIVIGLLVEILMVLFLSRTNIKKFTQLGNELVDTQTRQKNLQKLVEIQKPIIRDTYLAKIMEGSIANQQELDYAQQYLEIKADGSQFAVLNLIAYVSQYELHMDNTTVTGPENLQHKEIVLQAIKTHFKNLEGYYCPNDKVYALLLSVPLSLSQEEANRLIEGAFSDFHQELLDHHDIWTYAGLGGWNEGLMITWKSYQQALQTSTYATKRQAFRCYDNTTHDTSGFYYPIEMTTQLTNFITSGNKSQVFEIFEILRHENMEKRSLPLNMMKYLLSDIRNTLYKIRFTIKSNEKNDSELKAIDALFNEPKSLKLCEDLAIKLCELYEACASGNKLISNIKNYIDKNYQDPSLCLSKISDEFSISESYFSYLFKEELSENFSSYLERKRMEHALELIGQSTMNLSEVYKEVGYNNSHTFRRAFKKLYGISPKDARFQTTNIS